MTTIKAIRQSVIDRARHYNERAPGTDVLVLGELSGPDGMHYTLIQEPRHTHEDIAKAKRACRNHWDVTGFTILHSDGREKDCEKV